MFTSIKKIKCVLLSALIAMPQILFAQSGFSITNNNNDSLVTVSETGEIWFKSQFRNLSFNTDLEALKVVTKDAGDENHAPSAGLFYVDNPNSNAIALGGFTNGSGVAVHGETYGQTNANAGAFYNMSPDNEYASVYARHYGKGAAIYGYNSGLGSAGIFTVDNINSTARGLASYHSGQGPAIYGEVTETGTGSPAEFRNYGVNSTYAGVFSAHYGKGASFYGLNYGTGHAGFFRTANSDNAVSTLYVQNDGLGIGGMFRNTNESNNHVALHVESNGPGTVFYAEDKGTNGTVAHFNKSNSNNNGAAIVAKDAGGGTTFYSEKNGSSGYVGHFATNNSSNNDITLYVSTLGNGVPLLVNHFGSTGNIAEFYNSWNNRLAYIDHSGNFYADGAFHGGGADLAESFEVEGSLSSYEPGDVLAISLSSDRKMEKSSEPYSTLVAGVYATKPGVLLSESGMDIDNTVPMGVVGVLPTKVTLEGGTIKKGDLLVTSSTPGKAMKGAQDKITVGTVVGKALEDYDGSGNELIKVLVSIK